MHESNSMDGARSECAVSSDSSADTVGLGVLTALVTVQVKCLFNSSYDSY